MKNMKITLKGFCNPGEIIQTLKLRGYKFEEDCVYEKQYGLFVYDDRDSVGHTDSPEYFEKHPYLEHFLTFGGEFVTSAYWTSPATNYSHTTVNKETLDKAMSTVDSQYPCGCLPCDCAGCGEQFTDKHYEPLPIAPREEFEQSRMKELLAHINHAFEQGNDPAWELTLELHDIVVMRSVQGKR